MKFGNLDFEPVSENKDLVSKPTIAAIEDNNLQDILVSTINPELSDTEAFCSEYKVAPEDCVNCVIVEAKPGENVW